MKNVRYTVLFLNFLWFLMSFKSAAQGITISGKVVESQTQEALAFATVSIIDNTTDKAITGTMTLDDGVFEIDTESQNIYIKISFLGYQSKDISEFDIRNNKIDVGVVALDEDAAVPDNNSFGLSLNKRSEKFNLFTQLGLGRRVYPRDSENRNENLNTNTSIISIGRNLRVEKFYNITLGTDYYINDNNVLTLSGNFAYEIEDQPSNINFKSRDASNTINSEWNRTETTGSEFS